MGRRLFRGTDLRSRAPRPLFRFGNLGSFCQTRDAGASRTGRGFSTERRIVIHYYFHCFSLLFARAGNAGQSAQSRAAQGEIRPCVQRRIVISLLLTMPRCGSAAHDTKSGQHDVRPQSGHALPLRARCWPASSPGSALSSSRCQTARSARRRQGIFLACAARNRRPPGSSPEDHVECESF